MSSFLTEDEIASVNASDLHRKTPFLIRGVTQTQFSIARYYGGVTYNGQQYTYLPDTDELIRDDVLKLAKKLRKKPKKSSQPGGAK